MRLVSSAALDAVECLWKKKGKPVSIAEWANAIYGHATPTLQKKAVENISKFRAYAEERGFGLLVSVHESHGNLSRVTHVMLADEKSEPQYTTRDLIARKGRQLGFKRSFDRAIQIVKDEKLLPMAKVEEIASRNGRPLFLPQGKRDEIHVKVLARIEKKKTPQLGKAVKIKQ